MTNILELSDISFSYKSFKALKDVSLAIGPGVYGLLGPNGAGKTTMMKVILGFLKPDRGSGSVLGMDITKEQLAIRRKIGYMPESDCIIPGVDGVEFISYLGQLSGMNSLESIKRAHEVLYYTGLGDERYRKVDTYSTGMKQRLKLSAALVHDPELLFLDEPTSGMDPSARSEILDLIKNIHEQSGMNVIISSHILADIDYTCSHIMLMKKGELITSLSIEDFTNQDFNGDQGDDKCSEYQIDVKGNIDLLLKDLPVAGVEKCNNSSYKLILPDDFCTENIFASAAKNSVQIRYFKKSRVSLEQAVADTLGGRND